MIVPLFMTLTLTEQEHNLLEQLFLTYEKPVYYLSYKILGNQADAEDNAIQTFLNLSKVLRRIESNVHSQRNKAFIFTIARYAALDLLRKQRREVAFTRSGETDSYIDDIDFSSLDFRSLVDSMEQVNEQDAELLILKYVIGLKSREIAQVTGLSKTAVDVRLHRAKKRMRTHEKIQAFRKGDER